MVSATFGMNPATRSPGPIPRARSASAKRADLVAELPEGQGAPAAALVPAHERQGVRVPVGRGQKVLGEVQPHVGEPGGSVTGVKAPGGKARGGGVVGGDEPRGAGACPAGSSRPSASSEITP
jgi:hypothetical protein